MPVFVTYLTVPITSPHQQSTMTCRGGTRLHSVRVRLRNVHVGYTLIDGCRSWYRGRRFSSKDMIAEPVSFAIDRAASARHYATFA